jgi:aspartokinase/homoserine dehydrogenase 1
LVRKLLVMAREAGFALEPADVEVQPFLDRAATQPEAWPQHAAQDDAEWRERIAEAQAANLRWVMLAEVDASRARVGLRALPAHSPFADLPAGQNLVRIETDLQRDRPLWLGGPGAGPEITAAGVLSDVIDAAAELAASRYSASTRRSVAA